MKEVRRRSAGLNGEEVVAHLERGGRLCSTRRLARSSSSPVTIEVRVRGREGFAVSRQGTAAVALDLEVDDELAERGLVRDVVRQVQSLRRDARLCDVGPHRAVVLVGLDELAPRDDEIALRGARGGRAVRDPGPGEPHPLET